eukprot:gene11621-21862_t
MEVESEEDKRAVAAILLACAVMKTKIKKRRKRGCWTKPWLRRHDERGIYNGLVCELRLADRGDYRRFLRMNTETFEDSSWTPFESNEEVPFVFVADNAFPLSNICMKPYPENGLTDRKRVFNYRLSRFRLVTENAFGILTSVFRIFSTKINMHPDRATSVILASLVLHNMLRTKSSDSYKPKGFADEIQGDMVVDGQWRAENSDRNMQPLPPRRHGNNNAKAAAELRDIFADHFYGPGQVPWQWNHIMAKK